MKFKFTTKVVKSIKAHTNGRPDTPETTGGKITGREPNGAFYFSENGSGVGAYLWQKQNNKWIVISADTGSRIMRDAVNVKQG